jgi:hypothetical protein
MIAKYFINRQNRQIINFLKSKKIFYFQYLSIYGQLDYLKINKIQKFINWESQDFEIDFDDEFGPSAFHEIIGISDNTSIIWSLELLDEFKDKWNWKHLSRNSSLNWWSGPMIKHFEDKWDWIELSNNSNLNLKIETIEKFKAKWNWKSSNFHRDFRKTNFHEKFIPGICGNLSISWDFEKINKFQDLIDWHALSLNPNIEFSLNIPHEKCIFGKVLEYCEMLPNPIENYKLGRIFANSYSYYSLLNVFEKWNFKSLSYNPSLGKMIQIRPESVRIDFLNSYEWDWSAISGNPSIAWTINMIEFFKDRIDWDSFSKKKNFAFTENKEGYWSNYYIDKYKDKLNWNSLSTNSSLPWSLDFMELYKDLWNWENISLNSGIPWSKEILSTYETHLNWEHLSEYSVPWDRNLIRKFKNKISWSKISNNKKVKWKVSILKSYYRKLNMQTIFTNEMETPLSWDHYKFYLNRGGNDCLTLLQNRHFCENIIKPLLSEENYNDILNKHLN